MFHNKAFLVFVPFILMLFIQCGYTEYSKYLYDVTILTIDSLKNSDFNSVKLDDFKSEGFECMEYDSSEFRNFSKINSETGFTYIYAYRKLNFSGLILTSHANQNIKFLVVVDKKNMGKQFFEVCNSSIDSPILRNYFHLGNYILVKEIVNNSYDIVNSSAEVKKRYALVEIMEEGRFRILARDEAQLIMNENSYRKYLNL